MLVVHIATVLGLENMCYWKAICFISRAPLLSIVCSDRRLGSNTPLNEGLFFWRLAAFAHQYCGQDLLLAKLRRLANRTNTIAKG